MSSRATRGLAVQCRGLRQVYRLGGGDVTALAGIDLDVPPGAQLAIIGPSGSGKSTLLSLLAGLLRPTEGELQLGRHLLAAMSEVELLALRATEVGVVAQSPARNLLPYGTAEDNIRFAQRGAVRAGRDDLPAPGELLAELGLTELAGRPVARMSGGEQQRLSVAVGVAAAPGLLLVDEPTSQLDGRSRDRVVELLERVAARIGNTLLVVTHDPYVADTLGRVVTMSEGRLVSTGAPTLDESVAKSVRTRTVVAPVGEPVLAAREVSYSRGGRLILDRVSVQASAGEVIALLGPSGSGKSSLLALLAGLERPDGGLVIADGRAVTGVPPDFGLVLQGYGLVSMLTATENVAVPLQARGLAAPEIKRRTDAALIEVGLDQVGDHLVEELSGGQQQRVALARALVISPRVLLADEMTAELDHEWKERLLQVVLRQAASGTLVILATHDGDTAGRCDRQLNLMDGRLHTN